MTYKEIYEKAANMLDRGKITLGDFNKMVEPLNSEVQSEPHWIPVTEEPIPDGEYLVTWTSEIQEKPILSIICRYSGVWDCWELQLLGHQDINVLAYMELPEPYKGVTE